MTPRALALLGLLISLPVGSALAQVACPSGTHYFGGSIAPDVSQCVPILVDDAPPRKTVTEARMEALDAMDDASSAWGQVALKMANDVQKKRQLMAGKWEVYQDQERAGPGEFCAALFLNPDGLLRLSGPGGGYEGAMLTFWGRDIPRPEAARTVRVKLAQSDDTGAPQTVTAFNYTQPGEHGWGAIAIAVPSADALLANMIDDLGFAITIGDRQVIAIRWSNGLSARDRLKACLQRRGK